MAYVEGEIWPKVEAGLGLGFNGLSPELTLDFELVSMDFDLSW